jgi:hypothetical protein
MQVSLKHIPTFGFLLTLFCFLLPFVTLSCPAGQFTFSGIQLAKGTTIDEPQMFGGVKQREVKGEPLALAALLCALAGVGLGFIVNRTARFVAVGLGGVGAILLLLLRSKIEGDVLREGGGMFQVSYGVGFWLAFLGFIVAAALNVFTVKKLSAPETPIQPVTNA